MVQLTLPVSDVRGNLAHATVVTNEAAQVLLLLLLLLLFSLCKMTFVQDWLKDRWQAAADMNGTPLPGPHWLQVLRCFCCRRHLTLTCRRSLSKGRHQLHAWS